jgi:putative transcriptional regulator
LAIVYKQNILKLLKNHGYSTYFLAKNSIFGQATITKIRNQGALNFNDLNKICGLLHCQPGDLIEWTPDDSMDGPTDSL